MDSSSSQRLAQRSLAFALIASTPLAAAEILVLSAGAAQSPIKAALPAFEGRTGHKVAIAFGPAGEIAKRVGAGEVFDLLILPAENVEAYVKQGKVVPGSAAPLGKVGIGVAVREGAPSPDIATPEAFKQALARGEVDRVHRSGARDEREALRRRAAAARHRGRGERQGPARLGRLRRGAGRARRDRARRPPDQRDPAGAGREARRAAPGGAPEVDGLHRRRDARREIAGRGARAGGVPHQRGGAGAVRAEGTSPAPARSRSGLSARSGPRGGRPPRSRRARRASRCRTRRGSSGASPAG